MRAISCLLLLCSASIVFAQDQPAFKDAFGWESGLSYRRYVGHHFWIGVNVSGTYTKSLTEQNGNDATRFVANDSTASSPDNLQDTNTTYSGTVKLEVGKELFRYKKLNIDLLLAGGYRYSDSRTSTTNNGTYYNDQPGNSALGILALEPKVFLWQRISIGTQFGLQYTYTLSKINYHNVYSSPDYVEVWSHTGSVSSSTLQFFGNISLSSILIVHFYF